MSWLFTTTFNHLDTGMQEEYVREGIEWEHVEFFDNSSICDLVERTDCGLISLLDEAAMRKQPLAGFFMSQSTDGEQSPAALAAGFLDRAGHVHEQGRRGSGLRIMLQCGPRKRNLLQTDSRVPNMCTRRGTCFAHQKQTRISRNLGNILRF